MATLNTYVNDIFLSLEEQISKKYRNFPKTSEIFDLLSD